MQRAEFKKIVNQIWHFVLLCNQYNKTNSPEIRRVKKRVMDNYGITEICSFDKNNVALFYISGVQFKVFRRQYNTERLGISNLLTFKIVK
jgi:hypothetical protein